MKISNDVMDVLVRSAVEENKLFLPPGQLDRKLYVDTNKVLENIGGKWNRSAKAHLFESDPSDILDEIINTGEYTDKKKEYQFFATPKELVKKMIVFANISRTDVLLEPSAGDGAILEEFPKENPYVAIELMPENCKKLKEKGFSVSEQDFLETKNLCVDRIVMNPPFTKQQDVKHILHAWSLLADGGILVSIVSESPFFRENKLSQEFRDWIDENNVYDESLDVGTFKESGTMVKTRLIVARK